jgi:hypothetical protein
MRVTPAMITAVLSRIDPETGEITETHGIREIRQQLGAVRMRKSVSKPKARSYSPGAPTTATVERRARALEGVEDEALSGNQGHTRQRIVAPMTLLPALFHEQAQELAGAAEPPIRKTRLDRAFDHDGTQSLRWAMSRYVCDVLITQESASGAEGGARISQSRVPFSLDQQRSLARVAFVHKRLAHEDRRDLDQFAVMMGATVPGYDPVSMVQFGELRSGLCQERVQDGVAVGIILKLAERLHDVYRLMELPRKFQIGAL